VLTRFKTVPAWAFIALASNVLLLLAVFLVLQREARLLGAARAGAEGAQQAPAGAPSLGPRLQWTYEEWVAQLQREADAAAQKKPQRLSILAGDSISLWFPPEITAGARLAQSGDFWRNVRGAAQTADAV
jgi:hypothetical protein